MKIRFNNVSVLETEKSFENKNKKKIMVVIFINMYRSSDHKLIDKKSQED